MTGLDPLVLGLIGLAVLGLVVAGGAVFIQSRRLRAALAESEAAPRIEADRSAPPPPAPTPGLAGRFFTGFAKSREALARRLAGLAGGQMDDAAYEALEEALIGADVGVRSAMALTAALRERAPDDASADQLRALLRDELRRRLGAAQPLAPLREDGPLAILVVGVNGSGKTTTIGKLTARYVKAGHTVLLAAGDTFRAGAIEQLKVWGERSKVAVIAGQEGGDPAAVTFDALQAARARGVDVVICDTAGRLQAQKPLMDELGKVVRVMDKALPGAPHEVLLVLDGTIGQNALSQARIFKEVVGVTGVALTKLDGTARGGVVVAVGDELGLPVKLVGLGEGIDDLRDFDPDAFVEALLGDAEAAGS